MKKIISSLLALTLIFSISTVAFAADVKTIGSDSIQISKTFFQGKSNESLLIDGKSSNVNILVVNTWVGATVTAKNGNLLFISGGYAGMGGDVTPFVFDSEENGGMGDNPLVIPSDWAGQTILFTNSATNDQILCHVFDANYKPANSNDLDTSGSATVSSNSTVTNTVKVDTGAKLTVKAGKTYQFKITAESKPKFICANGSIFKVTYSGQKGKDYFFKATAVGKAGKSAGFYLNGSKTPCTIGTIG